MIVAMVFGGSPPGVLGHIPSMLNDANPKSAREQLDDAYQHGGGWLPIKGFKHRGDYAIKYPGDPLMVPLAAIKMRDEVVILYRYSVVAIFQKEGTFEVARMD